MKNISGDDGVGLMHLKVLFIKIRLTFKTLFISSSAGILIALVFIYFSPKKYEATANIEMAQFAEYKYGSNGTSSSIDVESPGLLISRLSLPTAYDEPTLLSCGLPKIGGVEFGGMPDIKVTPLRGTSNVVQLRAYGVTPGSAKDCAGAIVESISAYQNRKIFSYIESLKVNLREIEAQLVETKKFIQKVDAVGGGVSAAYLSTRDEALLLHGEAGKLKNIINQASQSNARLISPIYINHKPVSMRPITIFFWGLFGGMLFGIIFLYLRDGIAKLIKEI
ncbi:hypothetical protein [Polynucleobacter sp. UB-Siik-W21]|uniref:hypothetical protein n=1 Tax=Polynucleobacter sp. UB-Siik-W21 TaxID=1855646 RepID=UPI001BFE1B0B|nr:hypothetical protein [Polynucleobacter sp. UB-Siik-W21]QWD70697.1 hypothetical protein C2756_01585 [Polynucleobacter sp. UB-Siik-W21]